MTKRSPSIQSLQKTIDIMARRSSSPQPPSRSQAPTPLQFVTVTHPAQARDKQTMKKIRQSVMHNYLDRAEQDPNSTDVRVSRNNPARKRKRNESSPEQTPPETADPTTLSEGLVGPRSTPSTSLMSTRSHSEVNFDSANDTSITGAHQEFAAWSDVVVRNIARTSSKPYDTFDSLIHQGGLVPRFAPVGSAYTGPIAPATSGATPHLDAFGSGPHFDNPALNVEMLKHRCKLQLQSPSVYHVADQYQAACSLARGH